MRVISISAPDDVVRDLDAVVERRGYAGRSDLLRAAARAFLQQLRHEEARRGPATATVTVQYQERASERIGRAKHAAGDVLTSMVHTHAGPTCLEVLILHGAADRIRALVDALRNEDGALLVTVTYVDAAEGS